MILFPALKTSIGVFRLFSIILIIFVFINNFNWFKTQLNRFILFYCFYIFILCFFSSDLSESIIDGFFKIFISLMMIPIGIYLGNNDKRALIQMSFWLLLLLIVNYGFAQFLKIGNSLYDEDSFYSGGAAATTPIIIGLCIIVLMNGLNTNRLSYYNTLNLVIILFSILIVILSLKRGAILAMAAGILVYFIFSSIRSRFSLRVLFIGFGLLFLLIQFSSTFNQRFDARTTDRNSLENENRFKETVYIINEIENANIINLFFGREAFNSKTVLKKYFGKERQLHIDYNIILHGTGIIGIILYFTIFLTLIFWSRNLKKETSTFSFSSRATLISNENHATILSLILLSLVMSFSGGLQFSSYRIILFLYIGYFLGQSEKLRDLTKHIWMENKLKLKQ